MNGFLAILLKEFAHIRRDRSTFMFAFIVPAIQLVLFGYAIDVTILHIPTVVYDLDGRQASRRFIEAMVATDTFKVVNRVNDHDAFRRAIDSGHAKVGVLIPADYTERLLRREQAHVQVLIDGSDSQVATTAVNTVSLLTGQLSIKQAQMYGESMQVAPARDVKGRMASPIEARVRLLYNPNLESAHFFVPGLVGIILQLVLLFLPSFPIVKERQTGTLEQLFVTPVGRVGLLLGKLLPYLLMAFGELLIILVVMTTLFRVPIHGSLALLIVLSGLFMFTTLGLGLLVSTLASTQLQAMQFSFLVMLPSMLLSGFIFPRAEMPLPLYALGFFIPVTYFLEILRGIILRSADLRDLLPHVMGLFVCCAVILGLSLARFRKQIS